MANGWLKPEANAAAVGSLALVARKLTTRAVSLYEVARQDKHDANYRRDSLIEASPGIDRIALALSCALVVSDSIHGSPHRFREHLGKEIQWYSKSAHDALHRMRESLADPEVAKLVGTSEVHCTSGILAAALDRPDGLYEAMAMLDGWTGELLARMGHEPEPGGSTLVEAVERAGGAPCAVFARGNVGFPVVITSFDAATGVARGFPTTGFVPSDFWARRSTWLQDQTIDDKGETHWDCLPSRSEVLDTAMEDFRIRALPEYRKANGKGLYIGSKKMAERLGVSVPRLAAWMREQGLVVEGGDGWVPAPVLGRDSVLPKKDRMGRLTWVWSPSFVEELRPKAAEISMQVIRRGPAKPPPPPTDKQVAYLQKLHADIGSPMPEDGYPTRKGASNAIEALMRERKRAKHADAELDVSSPGPGWSRAR